MTSSSHVKFVAVELFVYDLSDGLASALSEQLLGKKIDGVWHTSVHIFGKEYWFGHGMQVGIPKQTQFGVPKQILKMGETQVDEELFQTFLDEIHPRFNVGTYNLLEHNCNNFSDECCEFLVGKKIPEHIVHLPNEVLNTPFGRAITPMLKVMENRMRNTRGQTVFAEDADAISEGRSEVLGGHAGATSSSTLPPPNTRGDDLAPLLAFGLQAFAQGLANAQPPSNNNNTPNNNNNNNRRPSR
ncbi:unnamed protein product [Bathycoccus prasinos]